MQRSSRFRRPEVIGCVESNGGVFRAALLFMLLWAGRIALPLGHKLVCTFDVAYTADIPYSSRSHAAANLGSVENRGTSWGVEVP